VRPNDPDQDLNLFLEAYREAFSRLDSHAITDLYCVPSGLLSGNVYIHWPDRESIFKNMQALCEHYRMDDFEAADFESVEVVHLGRDALMANVSWRINRFQGRPSSRFNTAYNLVRTAEGLRVLLCTAYEERLVDANHQRTSGGHRVAGFEDHFYQSHDGLSLYYRDYRRDDTGPASDHVPVLCLPGLTRNSKDFAAIAAHLAPDRRVLALEFRGRGRSQSDPASENYVPPTYARDVITLLDLLGLEKVVLLGTSLGGLVSMLLANMIADRIHGVILNDIGAAVDPSGLARISSYAGKMGPVDSWAQAAEQARTMNGIAFPDKNGEWWLTFAENTFRENEDGIPVLDYDPKIGDAMRASGGAPDPAAGWALFAGLQEIPTLVIRGELSDILSREVTEEMSAKNSDLAVAEIEGVGHAPTLEESDAVAAIDSFLAKR